MSPNAFTATPWPCNDTTWPTAATSRQSTRSPSGWVSTFRGHNVAPPPGRQITLAESWYDVHTWSLAPNGDPGPAPTPRGAFSARSRSPTDHTPDASSTTAAAAATQRSTLGTRRTADTPRRASARGSPAAARMPLRVAASAPRTRGLRTTLSAGEGACQAVPRQVRYRPAQPVALPGDLATLRVTQQCVDRQQRSPLGWLCRAFRLSARRRRGSPRR